MRRFFTMASVVSLLLCVTMAGVSVSSYHRYESPTYSRPNGTFLQLTTMEGDLVFDYYRRWPDDCTGYYTAVPSPTSWVGPLFGSPTTVSGRGFSFDAHDIWVATAGGKTLCFLHGESTTQLQSTVKVWWPTHGIEASLPLWFVCLLLALLPAARALAAYRARNAPKKGACPACGYDLRASKDRCPECGTAHPRKVIQTETSKQNDFKNARL